MAVSLLNLYSLFLVPSIRYQVQGFLFEVRGSMVEVRGSKFKVRGSKFEVEDVSNNYLVPGTWYLNTMHHAPCTMHHALSTKH